MQIIFKYDLQKDIENFLKSSSAVNSKKPTKLQRLHMEKYGTEPQAENAGSFIAEYQQSNQINIGQRLENIEEDWRIVERQIIERMEKLFGMKYPDDITVYLSSNSRCTYNIADNYFFVHIESTHSNGTIAHELLHFYTWLALHTDLEQKGISAERYNEIKESLTELLNIEFVGLLGDYHDDGYSQHADMRKQVRDLWLAHHDLNKVLENLSK